MLVCQCHTFAIHFCACFRAQKRIAFWYRSGSADLYLWLTDPATDPAIFVSDLQDKKSYRSHKTVGIKVFLTNFAWGYCRRIQSRICISYGTNGYGSERPKNIWIRIRKTASKSTLGLQYFKTPDFFHSGHISFHLVRRRSFSTTSTAASG